MNERSKPYMRVLLKLSGEMLADDDLNVSPSKIRDLAQEVKQIQNLGKEIAIVIGGGNLFRGVAGQKRGIRRPNGDNMGMLATIMNALALWDIFTQLGIQTRILSAFGVNGMVEHYTQLAALENLEAGRVVIFGGGIGNPYFSTDTAAVLRASEIEAEVVLKGTKVDGVYSSDPMKVPGATRFDTIPCSHALDLKLQVMDATAFALCMENKIPIIVFDYTVPGNLQRVVLGEKVGTLVTP